MTAKRFRLDEHNDVTIYKRRGNRNMRLSVTAAGEVRLSIPAWISYAAGLAFARSRLDWIASQRVQEPPGLLEQGQLIGKAHHLRFNVTATTAPKARLKASEVVVSHPMTLEFSSPAVQRVATQASIRALRVQAENLLPWRLGDLADKHDFTYRAVKIKQLKSRWGSCDQYQNIALNLFLMQLPWHLIDYVLLHELTHTEVLSHSREFWQRLAQSLPNYPLHRKELRKHKSVVFLKARI